VEPQKTLRSLRLRGAHLLKYFVFLVPFVVFPCPTLKNPFWTCAPEHLCYNISQTGASNAPAFFYPGRHAMSHPHLCFPHKNSALFAFSALNFNHPLSNTNSVCSVLSVVDIYSLSSPRLCRSIFPNNQRNLRNLRNLWSDSFLCSSHKKRLNLASIPSDCVCEKFHRVVNYTVGLARDTH